MDSKTQLDNCKETNKDQQLNNNQTGRIEFDSRPHEIGAEGFVVQIEESKFGKRNNNR